MLIPNISDGRDRDLIAAVGNAYTDAGAKLLATHADTDHHRSVHALVIDDPATAPAVMAAGAAVARERIDLRAERGLHPHIGVLDVAPVVYLEDEMKGVAAATALAVGEAIGEQAGIPVFLYGELADGRTRAELRRGGPAELRRRAQAGELRPDFGPREIDPRTGATMVAARPPLVAFNLELKPPATLADAKRIAALIREGGDQGLPGLRAIGLDLTRPDGLQLVQVSTNVEDHRAVPLVRLLEAVRAHAPVTGGELIGLVPRSSLEGWPDDVPIRNLKTIEDALDPIDL